MLDRRLVNECRVIVSHRATLKVSHCLVRVRASWKNAFHTRSLGSNRRFWGFEFEVVHKFLIRISLVHKRNQRHDSSNVQIEFRCLQTSPVRRFFAGDGFAEEAVPVGALLRLRRPLSARSRRIVLRGNMNALLREPFALIHTLRVVTMALWGHNSRCVNDDRGVAHNLLRAFDEGFQEAGLVKPIGHIADVQRVERHAVSLHLLSERAKTVAIAEREIEERRIEIPLWV